MRFSVLASGSGGNACYIETSKSRILVDAGLSCRELVGRLNLIGVKAEEIDAIIITHEHSDHIKGAGPISRRFDIPVFINVPTMNRCGRALGNISKPIPLYTGQTVHINGLEVQTFTKFHDAVDPMGLIISSGDSKLGIVTDLGRSSPLMEDLLKDCTAVILEFNHDNDMLTQGPYPPRLKRRIEGPEGHLSNKQACELLKMISHDELNWVVIAHISKINNAPEKAFLEAKETLLAQGMNNTKVLISYQDYPMDMMEV